MENNQQKTMIDIWDQFTPADHQILARYYAPQESIAALALMPVLAVLKSLDDLDGKLNDGFESRPCFCGPCVAKANYREILIRGCTRDRKNHD